MHYRKTPKIWMRCYQKEEAMLSNIYFIMNIKIIIIFILSTNNNYVRGSINTVQSEVSVGSKYWILSGLAVSQFSSENLNSIMRLNYVHNCYGE